MAVEFNPYLFFPGSTEASTGRSTSPPVADSRRGRQPRWFVDSGRVRS